MWGQPGSRSGRWPPSGEQGPDPAVVVVDELGAVRCPHPLRPPGGANDLAREIAGLLGGQAVLTTATDARGIFSFDQWARRLGCAIPDPEKIRPVASQMLAGGQRPSGPSGRWQGSALGSGPGGAGGGPGPAHHPGHAGARPEAGAQDRLGRDRVPAGASRRNGWRRPPLRAGGGGAPSSRAGGVCTIDRKGEEPGLLELCRRRRLPLLTYSPEELSRAEGVPPPLRPSGHRDGQRMRAGGGAGQRRPAAAEKDSGGGGDCGAGRRPLAPGWEEAP